MAEGKHASIIIGAVMALSCALCLVAVANADRLNEAFGGSGVQMGYESKLFDTDEVMTVDIQMSEDEWSAMLEGAMSEQYHVCDVTVNGTTVHNVAIRPKGNTSLTAIASDPDSDRYSLKLEFDHFVDGQTCYGLDKLILNNNYADATNMKEAVVYDMYQYLGVDSSLYNYAKVSVNGEYWGVYLALEGVEESFMLRNFGTQDGELYKPDSMEMGGGQGGGGEPKSNKDEDDSGSSSPGGMTPPSDMDMSDFAGKEPPSGMDMSDFAGKEPPSGDFGGMTPPSDDDSNRPGGGRPGSSGGGGANLNYTDDDLDSYSTIWEGEITDSGKNDHKRVVKALKNISEGNDLEKYLDVDNVLKYMAVHVFSVNMDSLSGSMAHNYYLYEYKGQLNLFPWDYNLSFGGMSMGSDGDATSMVNDAIDTPFAGTDFFDALLENDEYREMYHGYLRQLVEEYVEGGRFDEVYNRIRGQIDSLVESDPTAFYSYDEYETAAELLNETVSLRAESIAGQLDGTIPSTDDGQRQDSSKLVDASHIDVKDMGQFSMGGGGDSDVGFMVRPERKSSGDEQQATPQEQSDGGGQQTPPQDSGDGSFSPPEGFDLQKPSSDSRRGEGRPSGMPGQAPGGSATKQLVTYGLCLALMLVALLAATLFRRKR